MLDCIWNPPDLMRKPPSMSCEVWVFSSKLPEMGLKKAIEGGARRNAFIDIRRAERAGGAAEYREHIVEAMLEADMQRVLGFAAIQRKVLRAAV